MTTSKRLRLALVLAAQVLSWETARAAILHVPADYSTIQKAIDAAQSGDQILVARGTYFENLSITDKELALVGESGARETIVDGSDADSVLKIDNCRFAGAVLVRGFTLRRGSARGGSGGGIDQACGSMTIENDIITGNSALGDGDYCGGGGIYIYGGATIRHSRISSNDTNCLGGGIYVDGYDPSSPVLIADNVIESNIAGSSGGGAGGGIYAPAPATLVRNVIRGNSATDAGGGIEASSSHLYVADNAIYDNRAGYIGGVSTYISEAGDPGGQWVNNTIVGNLGEEASQLFAGGYASAITFANNAIVSTDGSLAVHCYKHFDAKGPIFRNNEVYAGGRRPASGACAESATHGSNMHVDPRFVDGANGHPYHLAPDSPLIDAGANRYVKRVEHDLGGRPRIIDGGRGAIVDIGAYEFSPE